MFVFNKTIGKYYSYGEEITKGKYDEILTMLKNQPEAPEGFSYYLNALLNWDLYKLPITDEDEVITSDEALAELMEVL